MRLALILAALCLLLPALPLAAEPVIYGEGEYQTIDDLICDLNGKPLTGLIIAYSPGLTRTESEIEAGRKHGWVRVYSEGDFAAEMHYQNGLMDGPVRHFTKDGRVSSEKFYEKGRPVQPAPAGEAGKSD